MKSIGPFQEMQKKWKRTGMGQLADAGSTWTLEMATNYCMCVCSTSQSVEQHSLQIKWKFQTVALFFAFSLETAFMDYNNRLISTETKELRVRRPGTRLIGRVTSGCSVSLRSLGRSPGVVLINVFINFRAKFCTYYCVNKDENRTLTSQLHANTQIWYMTKKYLVSLVWLVTSRAVPV